MKATSAILVISAMSSTGANDSDSSVSAAITSTGSNAGVGSDNAPLADKLTTAKKIVKQIKGAQSDDIGICEYVRKYLDGKYIDTQNSNRTLRFITKNWLV